MADRTRSSVEVGASPKEVMAVISDFPAYPEWATALRSAEVLEKDGEGRARRVRFSLDAGVIRDSYVLGYEWDGDRGVRWDLAEPGSVISAMTGGYYLAEAAGGTEVTYELTVDVRVPLLGMLKRKAEKVIIETALKGLKARAESQPADAASARDGGEARGNMEEGTQ
ncbi:MAG TPA: SRPBCC family protein [Streptosporangiaceae bacterium]|nr:SRPBCC family protein [Streptosporangiaceae bacterium]